MKLNASYWFELDSPENWACSYYVTHDSTACSNEHCCGSWHKVDAAQMSGLG